MIGYKVAKNNDTRVIMTLEIPDDAITNINRKDIVDASTAKYRTNKAKVLKIEDKDGKEYTSANSFIYNKKPLEYKLNETIVIDDYDINLEEVRSSGIHFFITKRVAELYYLNKIENCLFQSWYDNGQKEEESNFVNGELHGLYQQWHENGQKLVECTYVNGELHGLYQRWDYNGQRKEKSNIVNEFEQPCCTIM